MVEQEAIQPQSGGSSPTSPLQFSKHDYYVADAPLKDGQQMVKDFHYAKGGSNTAVYMHGLYRKLDNKLVGVAWWLPPTRVACESVNKENWKKVLSLTRLVIHPDVPTNGCSFLISKSVMLIRKDSRFVSLVTYACESQGHTGAIYKATNWIYVGRTSATPRWLDPITGRQVACKATKNRTKSMMLALGYILQGSFHKHKFIQHLT